MLATINLPSTIGDFFDKANFAGKRGVYSGAMSNLEIALMADGVAPADVYDVLDSDGGVDRALAKMTELYVLMTVVSSGLVALSPRKL